MKKIKSVICFLLAILTMIVMVSPMGAFAESATDGSRVPIGDKTDNEDNTVVLNTVNEASSENSTLKDA